MEKSSGKLNETQTNCFLGIDYGRAKVGLALADPETKLAFAYDTLPYDSHFLDKLGEIFEKESVRTVVIGIPAYINHENRKYESQEFGKKLRETFPGIEVVYQDEMFTTKMAQENLISRGVKNIKRYDDQEAARIILQEWLDSHLT